MGEDASGCAVSSRTGFGVACGEDGLSWNRIIIAMSVYFEYVIHVFSDRSLWVRTLNRFRQLVIRSWELGERCAVR